MSVCETDETDKAYEACRVCCSSPLTSLNFHRGACSGSRGWTQGRYLGWDDTQRDGLQGMLSMSKKLSKHAQRTKGIRPPEITVTATIKLWQNRSCSTIPRCTAPTLNAFTCVLAIRSSFHACDAKRRHDACHP